jgi:arylsulfatase B/arylsulfatase I/J
MKALWILDSAVQSIHDKLIDKGVLDNTYIIFASDNGGCPRSGGRNYPLRGQKGTLFEGGTKVESFIYSPLLPGHLHGTSFKGIFHVTDWFPTLASLTSSTYDSSELTLDGIDQYDGIINGEGPKRDRMLYNYQYYSGNDSVVGVRFNQYKLLFTYNSSVAGTW